MSEIKFACPHCSQHVACDDLYCGERINCPGCGKELFIPQLSAFIPLHSGNMTMAVPVASKERHSVSAAGLGLLSEEEWEARAAQRGDARPSHLLPVWILLFLPFVLAFLLVANRANPTYIAYCFILCALAIGFYLAATQKRLFMGLLYAIAAFVFYAIMAVGLLFIGCLVVLH